MNRRTWEKLRREIDALRFRIGSIRSSELVAIANRLGRRRFDRGKEPTYVSDRPGWFPLSIPGHPGTLKKGTARNIVNQLEHDLLALEVEVDDEDLDRTILDGDELQEEDGDED